MSKTGAARVVTSSGPEWCHYSRSGDTLKFRRFVEGAAFDFDADEADVEEWVTIRECKEVLPNQSSYAISAASIWTELLSRLNEGRRGARTSEKGDGNKPLVVPLTRLRRYYSSMKVFEKALFVGIAEVYAKNPLMLATLWNDSRKQFAKYNNQDGWDTSTRKSLSDFTGSLSQVSTTNEFTSYLCQHGIGEFGYCYVERELSPWNTRRGHFAGNRPATKTGRGGMDLLLISSDGVPVVGEVKVKNDRNAFFALLQAMTYAVEISTPNQTKRLSTHFPQFAHLKQTAAAVEIALVMVNPVADETLDPVLHIIRNLNRHRQCHGLARIRLIRNKGEKWISDD